MDEQRKASEILISIEDNVNKLIKIISVYDMNSKLTLDRVNKIYNYINSLQSENLQEEKETNSSDKINTNSDEIITMSDVPISNKRAAVEQPTIPKLNENDTLKKVPVIQRITDNNGKDLFMAEVIILNDNKDFVFKTKTNAVGKWQALLKPGKYSVNITKTDSATKNKIEASQDIDIVNSNSPIVLQTIIIKR